MRLVTWNVHGFVGRDAVRDASRSFRIIRSLDADIVALQEVEGSDWPKLARALGYYPILGRTRPVIFGNVLLTRVAVTDLCRLDLSVRGREPRGALDAVVPLPGGALRVVAAHLGLRSGERRQQIARLARHLDAKRGPARLVLLGDWNDWTPWGSQLRPLEHHVDRFSRVLTFPSYRPLFALDRAAWRGPRLAPHLRAVRTPAARLASDHLPLQLALEPHSRGPV